MQREEWRADGGERAALERDGGFALLRRLLGRAALQVAGASREAERLLARLAGGSATAALANLEPISYATRKLSF